MGGEGRGKERSERGDRAIHQAGQTGLDELQHEEPPVRVFFIGLGFFSEVFFFECARRAGMFSFFIGEKVQQFAHGHVGGAAGGAHVKAAGFHFHDFGLAARDFHAEWTHHPHRAALQEAAHVLAADGRDVIAKAMLKHGQQAVAMHGFFGTHLFKHCRGGRIGLAEGVSEFAVDSPVLLFVGDRQGQNLFFS